MKNFLTLFQLAFSACLLFVYVLLLNNREQVFPTILEILKVTVLVSISVVIVNALSFLIINVWFTRKKRKQPSKLLKLVISVILYSICAFIILTILGQDTTRFFTTSALFTAIAGFAMQEPLGNLLSGIFLQIKQPFQIGDRIEFQGLEGVLVEGIVESVDWSSTDVRLNSGEITYIPNGAIAKDVLKIVVPGSVYRTIDFSANANIPPNQVTEIVTKAVLNQPHPNINLDKPLYVRMWSYGLEEVNYKLFYYPINYSEAENHTDPEIRCRVWYALSRAGLGFEYQTTENERILELVNNIPFFNNLSIQAQSLLVEHSKTLLFDKEELLDRDDIFSPAMFLVVKGCVSIEEELLPNVTKVTVKPFSRQPQNHTESKYALKAVVIEQVASELARYIGPVAFSKTYQAAQDVSSLYWLYLSAAQEIENIDHRKQFLQHQPKVPTQEFLPGDFFGEMSLFVGEPLPNVNIITLEETEILAITPAAVVTALAQDGISINTICQYVNQYYTNYLTGTLQELSGDVSNDHGILEQMQEHFAPYFYNLSEKFSATSNMQTSV